MRRDEVLPEYCIQKGPCGRIEVSNTRLQSHSGVIALVRSQRMSGLDTPSACALARSGSEHGARTEQVCTSLAVETRRTELQCATRCCNVSYYIAICDAALQYAALCCNGPACSSRLRCNVTARFVYASKYLRHDGAVNLGSRSPGGNVTAINSGAAGMATGAHRPCWGRRRAILLSSDRASAPSSTTAAPAHTCRIRFESPCALGSGGLQDPPGPSERTKRVAAVLCHPRPAAPLCPSHTRFAPVRECRAALAKLERRMADLQPALGRSHLQRHRPSPIGRRPSPIGRRSASERAGIHAAAAESA